MLRSFTLRDHANTDHKSKLTHAVSLCERSKGSNGVKQMTDTNLPNWTGASTIYSRLMKAANNIQSRAYHAQRATDKRKRFRFSPHEDGLQISRALAIGDEETCKALVIRHRDLIWATPS